MASSNIKTPPAFKNGDDYEKWKKKLTIWQCLTSLEATKQGPALFLVLEGDAQDAVLELDTAKITSATGVKEILDILDKLYLKDKTQSAFEALEAFENYKRPNELSIADFCNEFERLYNKTKAYGTTLSEDVLAFRLLKASNLSRHQEQLAKATITELTLDKMKGQLKKTYGLGASPDATVKKEEVIPALEDEDEIMYERAFTSQRNFRSRGRYRSRPSYVSRGRGLRGSDHFRGGSVNQKKGKNPLDQYGNISRCVECESINHWVGNCPDRTRSGQETYQLEEDTENLETYYHITLFQSDYDEPQQLHGLTMEAINKAVLNCGAASTVCGDVWMKCYIDSLDEKEKDKIVYKSSNNKFKFGYGEKVCSQQLVKIPALVGQRKIFIETDVVKKNIPLLLFKNSMKKADTELNFRDDTVRMFNQKLNLQVRKSGHYTMLLDQNKKIMMKIDRKEIVTIILLN